DFGLQVRRTEKVLLVTFVTHDKSNPKRSKRTKTICTVYPQSNSIKAKSVRAALEAARVLCPLHRLPTKEQPAS
ncbi:MAG: hypothetical protein J6D79_02445, partial [Clostridia bacterium]|nr:hypothetical protein [Clostridia bacterium]